VAVSEQSFPKTRNPLNPFPNPLETKLKKSDFSLLHLLHLHHRPHAIRPMTGWQFLSRPRRWSHGRRLNSRLVQPSRAGRRPASTEVQASYVTQDRQFLSSSLPKGGRPARAAIARATRRATRREFIRPPPAAAGYGAYWSMFISRAAGEAATRKTK